MGSLLSRFKATLDALREDQLEIVMAVFEARLKARLNDERERLEVALREMENVLEILRSRGLEPIDYAEVEAVLSLLSKEKERQRKRGYKLEVAIRNRAAADKNALISQADFIREWNKSVGRSDTDRAKAVFIAAGRIVSVDSILRRARRLKIKGILDSRPNKKTKRRAIVGEKKET